MSNLTTTYVSQFPADARTVFVRHLTDGRFSVVRVTGIVETRIVVDSLEVAMAEARRIAAA